MAPLGLACLLWILVSHVAQGAESARSHWAVPNGKEEVNFKQTWYVGDQVIVKWGGWDSSFTGPLLDNATLAQLYVLAWGPKYSSYSQLLSARRDISSDGTYDWTVNISEESLANTKEYSFSFVPLDTTFEPKGPHISSPGFHILPESARSSSTSMVASTLTTSSTPTSSFTPTSSSTPTNVSDKDGLSTGAKAGIGVGASVGGLLLLAALGFFILRRRKRGSSPDLTETPKPPGPGSDQSQSTSKAAKPAPHELYASPPELSSRPL